MTYVYQNKYNIMNINMSVHMYFHFFIDTYLYFLIDYTVFIENKHNTVIDHIASIDHIYYIAFKLFVFVHTKHNVVFNKYFNTAVYKYFRNILPQSEPSSVFQGINQTSSARDFEDIQGIRGSYCLQAMSNSPISRSPLPPTEVTRLINFYADNALNNGHDFSPAQPRISTSIT